MLLDLFSDYKKLASLDFEKNHNDDFYDKLSRKFSAIMMIIFSTLLGVYQLVGKPLSCWCRNEFSGSRCTYALTYCYITNFYVPVGNNTELPKTDELRSHKIYYYQWVPYIFIFQAFLFFLPSLVWNFLSTKSGFDLKNYVMEIKKGDKTAIKYISTHIKECTNFRLNYENRGKTKKFISNVFRLNLFNNGLYLTLSYLFVKILYALVALTQIFLLNYWFRDDYYGKLNKFYFLFGPHNWKLSERFPRMTFCEFEVYEINARHNYFLQCTLPINIYIEKMYLIIGIWSIILFFLTFYSLMTYVVSLCFYTNFIKKRLDIDEEKEENLLTDLRPDDVLVLKLIKANTSDIDVTNLIKKLNKLN